MDEEFSQETSFWSVEFCCQWVRQGMQKEWLQSRVKFGLSSTQMGQGSVGFSALVIGVDEVDEVGVDGGVVGGAPAVVAAVAALCSAAFSDLIVLRRE